MYDWLLCHVILAIWSWSLLQFTIVITASRSKHELLGILVSIVMQDGPFLGFRLLLIIRHDVISYTNTFFACKNILVILLLLYRLVAVQVEKTKCCQRNESSADDAVNANDAMNADDVMNRDDDTSIHDDVTNVVAIDVERDVSESQEGARCEASCY